MATLKQKTDGGTWYARIKVFDQVTGGWKITQKSTKTTNKEKAQRVADKMEEMSRLLHEDSTMTRETATRIVDDILRLSGVPLTVASPVFSDFARIWMESKKVAASTRAMYQSNLRAFLSFKDFENKHLDDFSPIDIQEWVNQMEVEGRSGARIHDLLKCIASVFEWAIPNKYIFANPCKNVSLRHLAPIKCVPFDNEEFLHLLNASNGTDWYGMCMVGWSTGMRIGDAAKLRMDDFADNDVLTFTPKKTQRQIVMPVIQPLKGWLATVRESNRQAGMKAEENLFPSLCDKKTWKLTTDFEGIVEKAGIDLMKGLSGMRVRSRKTFKSFRMALASRMAEAGTDIRMAQEILGHHSADVHIGYVQVQVSALKTALEVLEPALDLPALKLERKTGA